MIISKIHGLANRYDAINHTQSNVHICLCKKQQTFCAYAIQSKWAANRILVESVQIIVTVETVDDDFAVFV